MVNTYIFEYLDENDFRKKERSVRKYNMLAYKKLTFEYYDDLVKTKKIKQLVMNYNYLQMNYLKKFMDQLYFIILFIQKRILFY